MKTEIMARQLIAGAITLCLAAVLASPASAFVNEVRGGVYAHDVLGPAHESDGADLTGEILFDTPSFLEWAFNPRPRLGGTLNFNGDTSLIYLDPFGWTIDLTDTIFVDGSLGAAVHDGRIHGSRPGQNQYGCRWNFHETASIGYRIAPNLSVMASLEHISNAGLCSVNDGLTNVGMRVGYSF
ncbi:acyloxyacyl hydrolase [Parvibaculum sp.]|uniref:acyloxyacyl hydrolase n=1 Tax=Parvibaculum sp. TaxID=2024848 RepID=UPI001B1202EF|nr:acyloxyacyl hydrolase [Parvibaculum sp.]MBO6634513.1 acyloxyacyl hydrolase [Parvibaculum sp.]MBO6679021.1 acyloxyacyl hydrolase [Parvibaculum sp.]MBO6685272.1 acyloxyacyl hydrolase [Parvibaculum sp.]MBO6906074.1 acyloxyacyl hydrolase [Parvibaculum sp.]